MAELIRMPRMSDTMEEGVIVEWLKEEGDKVQPGDVLAEVETDKATMELESFQEGVLLHIGVREGPVPVDGVLAVIGEEGEDYKELLEEAEKEQEEQKASEKEIEEEEEAEEIAEKEEDKSEARSPETKETEKTKSTPSSGDGRIKASPLARTMAEEEGIQLSRVDGSGDGGRIVKRDIAEYLEKRKKTGAPVQMPVVGEESSEEIPVSQMRKTIAKRLTESKYSAPHFYLTVDLDMHSAVEARKRINEMIEPDKISYNDLIIKCCAAALRKHPDVNASWKGDVIERHHHIHIGFAVAVEEGLLVPVLRHADQRTISQINAEVKDKAEQARNKELPLEDMQGNTFTISNLGMFGIEEFTGIINPPDSCIMAVGSIRETPVVEDGELTVGHRMKVTLSCDHRIVDGATGAKFLQTFREMMEDPIRMIV